MTEESKKQTKQSKWQIAETGKQQRAARDPGGGGNPSGQGLYGAGATCPFKRFFCVLQLIVSFVLLGFLLQMASLQQPFLFFIFDSQVYVDDFGGVEETEEKALESFHSLGNLLVELGLEEGVDKAQGDKGTLAKSGLARDVQNANR